MVELQSEKTIAAYTAGLIDGEGCITVQPSYKRGRVYYNLSIFVSNTNKDVLNWMKSHWGGSIHIKRAYNYARREKEAFVWACSCRKALTVLSHVYPYLIVKRAQAKLGLSIMSKKEMGRYGDTPQDEYAKCYQKMKLLNGNYVGRGKKLHHEPASTTSANTD